VDKVNKAIISLIPLFSENPFVPLGTNCKISAFPGESENFKPLVPWTKFTGDNSKVFLEYVNLF